jgi:hypothetical protein
VSAYVTPAPTIYAGKISVHHSRNGTPTKGTRIAKSKSIFTITKVTYEEMWFWPFFLKYKKSGYRIARDITNMIP